MFDMEIADLDAAETLAATARLHALQRQVDAQLLELGAHYADLFPGTAMIPGDETIPGGERAKVYGGPGCPSIADFAAAEFGVVTGRSAAAAARYLGQALSLRHRLPRIWEEVKSDRATPWKACQVATACLALSLDAAAIVDQRVALIIDTVTPYRLSLIVKAAIWQADPEAARKAAEEKARERGVWTGRTDDHGTTTLFVRAATGDVIRLDATLTQIADALAALGDTSPLDRRRAKAIGILADPKLAHYLLDVAQILTKPGAAANPEPAETANPAQPEESDQPDQRDEPEQREQSEQPEQPEQERRELAEKLAAIKQAAYAADPTGTALRKPARTNLYVHIAGETLLAGEGVARVEGFGPVLASRLSDLLGHDQIVLRPVIDLNDEISVDAYEIPHRIRERIKLTHPVEQFPFGTGETTHSTDLDHIHPFSSTGPPRQTSTTNLTPLRRYSHRVKTHGRWKVHRLDANTLEWTTPHGYKFLVDPTGTHPNPHPQPD